MKPLLKYRGGKAKEIPHIAPHIPPYKGRYIEPFVGGGALFFHLAPQRAIINDINAKLISFYNGVKDDYPALRKELDGIERLYDENRRAFDALKRQTPQQRVEDKNEEIYYPGQRQYEMEGEPVSRHLGQLIKALNKPTYGLFIAPHIHEALHWPSTPKCAR